MDIRKLQRAIVDGLEDVKGQHIAVFNTEHLSSMFERVIIASGTSNRQTKALAASVRNSVKGRGMQVMATEGEDNGEWIIVDCGAAVAHIMQPAIREYYHLEEIWGGKPVRIAKGETVTRLVKASEPEAAPRSAARKTAAAKTAAKTARPPSPAARPRAAATAGDATPAKQRPPARSNAVKQAESEKKVANRTAAFKRVAAKPTPTRAASTAQSPAGGTPKSPAGRETRAPASKTIVVKPAGKPAAKAATKSAPRPPAKSAARPATRPAARPAAKRPAAKASGAVKKPPARKPTPRG